MTAARSFPASTRSRDLAIADLLARGTPHKVIARDYGLTIHGVQKAAYRVGARDPRRVRTLALDAEVARLAGLVPDAEIARRLGVSASTVANAIRRIDARRALQRLVTAGVAK